MEENLGALAVVSSDGTVMWIPQVKLRVRAIPSPTKHAWWSLTSAGGSEEEEEQDYDWSCKFKFGSWTYDGFKLDVDFYDNLEEIDVTDYAGDLTVVTHEAVKNVIRYPCCMEPYPDLTFTLQLKE